MVIMNTLNIVAVELLAQCNLYCSFCIRNATNINKSIFPEAQFSIFVEQLTQFSAVPSLAFTGGEPLMLKNIEHYCEYAKKNNIPFSITTNGTIHRLDLIKSISDMPNFKHFIISIDSSNVEMHNSIRGGKNSLQKTIAFTEYLKAINCQFCINMTVSDQNYLDVFDTIHFAKKLGAKDISVATVKPNGRGDATLTKEMRNKIASQIIECKPLIDDSFKLWSTEVTFFLYDFEQYKEMIERGDTNSCAFGNSTLHVQVDGTVLGCTACDLPLGNVFNQSKEYLEAIWNNDTLLNQIRSKQNLESTCGSCKFKQFCGGCRCRAKGVYDNIFADDPYCPIVQKEISPIC